MIAEILVASFYLCNNAKGEGGRLTSLGRRCDPRALTVAHPTYKYGRKLIICHDRHCVIAKVNDRGPFVKGRDIDVTPEVAKRLHMLGHGVVRVTVSFMPLPRPNFGDRKDIVAAAN